MLVDALPVVAAVPPAQVAWLEKHDVPPDEIALGFDDAYRLVGRLVEEDRLSPGVLPEPRMIDEVCHEMTHDTERDRWAKAALSTDMGWARARQLARVVLAAEGEAHAPLPEICTAR
ncbi:hypothetical protein [Streptomyces noursei]|uniref:hypothetical protein n=1 Tax=Streptomyces noursei TaxID=1971 RepID=UPI0037F1920E